MFFLAATLVGWIGGDFVYRKVAAKNIFLQKRLNRSRYHWNKEPCIGWAQISMETVNFEWDMCPTTLGQWTRPVFGRNPTSRNDATGESCSSDALWRRCFCGTSLLLFVVVIIFYFFCILCRHRNDDDDDDINPSQSFLSALRCIFVNSAADTDSQKNPVLRRRACHCRCPSSSTWLNGDMGLQYRRVLRPVSSLSVCTIICTRAINNHITTTAVQSVHNFVAKYISTVFILSAWHLNKICIWVFKYIKLNLI